MLLPQSLIHSLKVLLQTGGELDFRVMLECECLFLTHFSGPRARSVRVTKTGSVLNDVVQEANVVHEGPLIRVWTWSVNAASHWRWISGIQYVAVGRKAACLRFHVGTPKRIIKNLSQTS